MQKYNGIPFTAEKSNVAQASRSRLKTGGYCKNPMALVMLKQVLNFRLIVSANTGV